MAGQKSSYGAAGQTVAAPGSGVTVAETATLPAGKYRVRVTTLQAGTVDATKLANVALKVGGAAGTPSIPLMSAAQLSAQDCLVTIPSAGAVLGVYTTAVFGAGAVVIASISATYDANA